MILNWIIFLEDRNLVYKPVDTSLRTSHLKVGVSASEDEIIGHFRVISGDAVISVADSSRWIYFGLNGQPARGRPSP